MTWIDCYISFKKGTSQMTCPNCGKDTLYGSELNNSVTLSCDNCKAFRHYDEIKESTEAEEYHDRIEKHSS